MDALQGAIDVDTNIFFSINRMHNMYFDYFMSAYSGKWVWIPMYAAIWYVMLRNFHWKVTLFCMIGLALTITFADQACATWIRPYVERMRPSNLNNPISEMVHIVNNHRGGRYGFPSCHAANTFGLAFFLFFLFRKRWLTLLQLEVGGEVGRKTGCAKCFHPGGMVLYRCPFALYTSGVLPGETVVFS